MYKVRFRPESNFISELHSSTIFGALCHAVKTIYGEDVLVNEVLSEDNTSLAVSDAFKADYIPGMLKSGEDPVWQNIETGEEIASSFHKVKVDHTMIDRDTGTSIKHWETIESTSDDLDVYVESSIFSKDELAELFKHIFTFGIGRGKSSGKGVFKFISITEVDLSHIKDTNGYMVLGDYIPNENDSTDGVYSIRVIKGKTVDGDEKKPVYVVNAGSWFKGITDKNVIGRLEKDPNTGTYTSGRALVMPITV